MEQLASYMTRMGIENPEREGAQPPTISAAVTKAQSGLSKLRESETARLADILIVIGEVENSKQIHLSDAERTALQVDLFNLGEPVAAIRRMADAVKRNTTYGKISIDAWLSNENIYTSSEIDRMVSQRIEQRKHEIERTLMPSEDELARMGLVEVQRYYNNKLKESLEKIIERTKKRCKILRAQFYQLSEQSKIDLWQKAVARGLVKDGDPHAMLILPFLVAEMMTEFSEAVTNERTNTIPR